MSNRNSNRNGKRKAIRTGQPFVPPFVQRTLDLGLNVVKPEPQQPGLRVQGKACSTCIFSKGSPLDIEKLLNDVRDKSVRPESGEWFKGHRICHHSLSAVCAGFWARYKDRFALGQIAQRLGLVHLVQDENGPGGTRPAGDWRGMREMRQRSQQQSSRVVKANREIVPNASLDVKIEISETEVKHEIANAIAAGRSSITVVEFERLLALPYVQCPSHTQRNWIKGGA